MTWFFIALCPPILYAIVTHLDKFLIGRFRTETGERGVGGLILYSTLFGLVVSLFLLLFLGKKIFIPLADIGILFLVGISGVIAVTLYLYAMEKDEASIVSPLFQMIPVIALVLEYFILGITPATIQIIGSFIIVVSGIVLATEYKDFNIRKVKLDIILLMFGSSFFFSLISILFKYVTGQAEDFWVSSFWEYLSWGIVGIIIFLGVRNYRKDFLDSLRRDGRILFGMNIFGESVATIANSLKNFAALLVPVALVYSVEATQPIFVFSLGIIITRFFPKLPKEDISREALIKKSIPIAFMIIGTMLILL